MIKRSSLVLNFGLGVCFAGSLLACSGGGGGGGSSSGGDTNYTVGGKVAGVSVVSVLNSNSPRILAKTITHVMAVSADGQRYVGALDSAGNFSLPIKAGKPYTLVFIDESQVGENMVVGLLKPDAGATGLDTLIPASAGSANLGNVSVDGTAQTASMGTSLNDFLAAMGVDSAAATTIGAVDDLALRLANPDINSNGEIDALESNLGDIRLDIHVRSVVDCTSDCSTGTMPIHKFVGTFITDVAGYSLEPSGTSIYLVYTNSFDSTPASQLVTAGTLSSGVTYSASAMASYPSPDIDTPGSYSGSGSSVYTQWGPDYRLDLGGIELPGYDKYVKLQYGMNSKTLSFPFFRSRPKSDLFNLIPDFKLTVSGGFITAIDYRWLKWTGSAWTAATASEVKLLVVDNTAAFGFYTAKGGGVEEGIRVQIPNNSASGTIPWNSANVTKTSGVTQAINQMAITDFCSGTSSYDDTLGLRIFSHGFAPATGGPSTCY